MPRYLIAGWAGSGKTTIANALKFKGLNALDSDEVPGLSSWRDRATNEIVEVDYSKPIDFEHIKWAWDQDILEATLDNNETIYFCGNVSNLWDYTHLFDLLIVLDITEDTQRQRLQTRTNSAYGKETSALERTIRAQKIFKQQALERGVHLVSVEQPVENVVNKILEIIHEHK